MNEIERKIAEQFLQDIEEMSSNFVASFGLRHKKEVGRLSDSFFRWMDFRLRYIEPKPRKIILSKRMNRLFPFNTRQALEYMLFLIQNGHDLNPYQGKGLILHHDTSGKSRDNRTDLLWADWGISHLHLTTRPIPREKYFCLPSDWLLFAIVEEDIVACIDVRSHKEQNVFSNPDLIKIVHESWPEYMEKFKMRDIHVPDTSPTAEDYKKLRKNGIIGVLTIDGHAYIPPGMGISTASTSSKVTDYMDDITRMVLELAKLVVSDNQFNIESDVITNSSLNFELCITQKGLAVFEKHFNKAWVLPRKQDCTEKTFLTLLHDMFAPEWAIVQLNSSEGAALENGTI